MTLHLFRRFPIAPRNLTVAKLYPPNIAPDGASFRPVAAFPWPQQRAFSSSTSSPLPNSRYERRNASRISCSGFNIVRPRFLESVFFDSSASGIRAAHSAASDDEESDDVEDVLFVDRNRGRNAHSATKKQRPPPARACESDEDDDYRDSEDSEDEPRPRRSRMPTQKTRTKRPDGTRVASVRRSREIESDSKRRGVNKSVSQSDMDDASDSESSSADVEPSSSEGISVPEDADNPSHLTNTRFDKFDISPYSIKALHSVLKYEKMTEVQEATFPVILKGQDVMAKARTGTGKTIAFLLPAIEAILKAPEGRSKNPVYVLIVCPTRELAQQAAKEAHVLLKFHKGLGAQAVFGGNSIRTEQMNLFRNPCQIIVGTPGRLVDHIQRTAEFTKQLRSVKMFVLDEADHMLDMGFRDSLHKIMQALPSQRQTLLFSATIPQEVHNISKVALRDDHVFIDAVGKNSQDTHAKVKQQYIVVPLEKQLRVLYAALREHMEVDPQYKVLVFCTTARVTAFMCKLFSNLGFNAREIHSRKDQRYRTRVSDEFRQSKGGIILFTSDVSARGVDYPNVTLVMQVGAPSDFEQYIHRLGRTGRAGKKGEGLLILAPWEDYFLQKLQSENLPITLLPAPKLTSQAKIKILTTASRIDFTMRETAYQAWLGYYKSLKGITLDKVKLVQYANQFSSSMGFEEPPAISRMLASKMNLMGVPGIKISR